jgi:hypothetical protein
MIPKRIVETPTPCGDLTEETIKKIVGLTLESAMWILMMQVAIRFIIDLIPHEWIRGNPPFAR